MKRFFLLIAYIVCYLAIIGQSKSEICENMGLVKVYFTSETTLDSLKSIKRMATAKGIEINYIEKSFNSKGGLKYLYFKIRCKGCGTGGSMELKHKAFRKGVNRSGFYFNHKGDPYFLLGEIEDL